MNGGAMGMTVDQQRHLLAQHSGSDCLLVYIHDGLGFVLVCLFTVGAHPGRNAFADPQRQRQEQSLDPRIVHFGTKAQITRIVGAERITVHDEQPMAVERQYLLFRQQRHAACARKASANQEIPIAMDEEDRNREGAQGAGNLLMQRIGIVVTNPGFEQIAENIERVAVGRFAL